MKIFYPVIFTKESTGYSTITVDLDGCYSEGDNFDEAYTNTQNAIGLYLDGLEKIPSPSDPSKIAAVTEKGQFMCVVEFDNIEYKKRNSSKSVKKTLTIPEWLNDEAERQHVNFSGVLQEALKARLNV